MSLLAPRYGGDRALDFDRLARAILTADQFDDWLPDPVYYEDQLNDLARLIDRTERLFAAPSIDDPRVEALPLPRAGGGTVPAMQLPLDLRLCAHAVIAQMAPGVNRALPRDKVYGFRFQPAGATVFDAPGEELERVYDLVARVARASIADGFELLDVISFNASARPDVLAATLERCGARADEAGFIRDCAALGGRGLPSVDDAFAQVYNAYLQPVDQKLLSDNHNFFRYRDEYFVFDAAARLALVRELGRLMLQARPVVTNRGLNETIERHLFTLGPGPEDRGIRFTERLVTTPHGTISATFSCTPDGKGCTDEQEAVFFTRGSTENLFVMPVESLDAIRALPYLRSLHARRRAWTLSAPPFANATPPLAAYRRELRPGRAWLGRALGAALTRRISWTAGWAATLLSDLGPLSDAETGQMLKVLSSGLDESAKVQARIALARSSSLPAERFWTAGVPTTDYRLRGMLVAARHLFRRSAAPWTTLTRAIGGREPELVRHLTANIRGTA